MNKKLFWSLMIALRLLTILPVPDPTKHSDPQTIGLSVLFYPVAGLLIGVLLFLGATLLYNTPPILSGSLLLALWCFLTGGLHLDGYIDTTDAYLSQQTDRTTVQNIMRDPHVGGLSVVAVVLLLMVKYAGIYGLLLNPFYLVIIPFLSRGLLVGLITYLPYKQSSGMGQVAYTHLPKAFVPYVLGVTVVVMVLTLGLLKALVLGLLIYLLCQKIMQWLGHATGDVYGFFVEVIEVLLLVLISI